jgi:hypothetical protein
MTYPLDSSLFFNAFYVLVMIPLLICVLASAMTYPLDSSLFFDVFYVLVNRDESDNDEDDEPALIL